MASPSIAVRIRTSRPVARTIWILVLVALAAAAAIFFALTQSAPGGLAWWWPTAGIGVVATAATPLRWRWLTAIGVGLASGAGSWVADRPLLVIILGSVGMIAEAWIVATAVTSDGDRPRLGSLLEFGRFALGTVAGAALVAALLGVATEFGGGAFMGVFWAIFASHLSAVILLAPLGLVTLPGRHTRWVSSAVITLAMLAATAFAFWPGTPLAVPIIAVPLMAWAAVTSPTFYVVVQIVLVVGLTAQLTALGGGMFASPSVGLPTVTALQIFAIALSGMALAIAATQNDRLTLENKQSAISHLLHDAFRGSKSGFAILQDDGGGTYSVLEINAAAVVLLRDEFERNDSGKWILRDTALLRPWLERASYDVSESVDWEDVSPSNLPATITIDAVNRTGLNRVILLAIQDLRPLREAEREMERRLERERQVSRTFQALNQQKVDFVASVTHELRTPITSILGFAEELSEATSDPELREYVEVISRNATRLRGVVDDVLLVSKMSRTPAAVNAGSQLDAGEILRRSLTDATHSIRNRGIQVVTEIEDDLVVLGRENDLMRVFTNILTNAVKFSPEGGRIEVVAYRAEQRAVITITDQGEGISEEDLAHIFDRFYRSASSTQRGVPGTGLGLAIVKELLAGMGGQIELSRAAPVGTTAQITLALVTPRASAPDTTESGDSDT
ncbi:hypothetical protein GCM10009808_25630 [Microbacterium sediminicola]|uniref:histidine kinase n=1 Tax=Microbacterium sediminicola TaxID=415210 RepID=A0ABP4UJ00_9MICO